MDKFNPEQLMENILSVIEQRKLKIGEVEKRAGLAVGYLARQARGGKGSPTLETGWRIARVLGVSLDWLIEGSARTTDQAEYLGQFVQRLFDQTREGRLDWGRYTLWDINEMLNHGGPQGFPALEESAEGKKFQVRAQFPGMDPMDYSMNVSQDGKRRIRAATRSEACVAVAGSCFFADFSEEQRIFLIPYVERMATAQDGQGGTEFGNVIWYELLLQDRREETLLPVCSTLPGNEAIRPGIVKLYAELKAHENEVRVAPGVRQAIDRYMERTAPVRRDEEKEAR